MSGWVVLACLVTALWSGRHGAMRNWTDKQICLSAMRNVLLAGVLTIIVCSWLGV